MGLVHPVARAYPPGEHGTFLRLLVWSHQRIAAVYPDYDRVDPGTPTSLQDVLPRKPLSENACAPKGSNIRCAGQVNKLQAKVTILETWNDSRKSFLRLVKRILF
ncbi:MAG: hypothetical protein ACFFA5_01380 [Promethearchaeota archaeon]